MKSPDKEELKELLNKGWMTHDGMWFFHCLQECGIEKTNRINKAAIKSMAKVEIKRMQKALDVEKIDTFSTFKDFMEGVYEIVKADFMNFTYSFPGENLLHMDMLTCFAYDGIQRMGVIDQYQCGIFERIKGWLEALGVQYSVTPDMAGCMMHTEGKCFRDFRLNFP